MRSADIADYLGLRSETLSRQFAALRREGLISVISTDRFVQIHDIERLATVAGFGVRRHSAMTPPLRPDTGHRNRAAVPGSPEGGFLSGLEDRGKSLVCRTPKCAVQPPGKLRLSGGPRGGVFGTGR